MRSEAETLEPVARRGRVKYFLAGKPLSGGDIIDLCFSGGWVTGRYEWNGDVSQRPYFHYSLELLAEGAVVEGMLEIPDGAVVRWPLSKQVRE